MTANFNISKHYFEPKNNITDFKIYYYKLKQTAS